MSIKAVLVALVVASSSTASAATFSRTVMRQAFEHRTLPSLDVGFLQHVVEQPSPMVLANDTRLASRMSITIEPTRRPFTKLELRANAGRTAIDRVIITYKDGRTRVVKLGRVIYGTKTLSIAKIADSAAIKSIVVVGSSKRGASMDVYAS